MHTIFDDGMQESKGQVDRRHQNYGTKLVAGRSYAGSGGKDDDTPGKTAEG